MPFQVLLVDIVVSIFVAIYLGVIVFRNLGLTISWSGRSVKAKIASLRRELQQERIKNFILEAELERRQETKDHTSSPFADGEPL